MTYRERHDPSPFDHTPPSPGHETRIAITPVHTVEDMQHLLVATGASEATVADENITHSLSVLMESAAEQNSGVFVATLDSGPWAVVAKSPAQIADAMDKLTAAAALQANIKSESLRGACVYVHEFASALGLSEGSMRTSTDGNPRSLYPIPSLHHVAYTSLPASGDTMYFDLSAKYYFFSPTGDDDAEQAVLQGLAVVEEGGQTRLLQSLFQTPPWIQEPFPPSFTDVDFVLESGRAQFLIDPNWGA